MKNMCSLYFPNGETVLTHIWNGLELNKCLKNN